MSMVNQNDLNDLLTKLSAHFDEQDSNLDAKFNEITKKYDDIAKEIRETRYQHDTHITKLEEKHDGLQFEVSQNAESIKQICKIRLTIIKQSFLILKHKYRKTICDFIGCSHMEKQSLTV